MPIDNDLEIVCGECQKNTRLFPAMTTAGDDRSEVWDTVEPLLREAKWEVRKHPIAGRYAVCPDCVRMEKEVQEHLVPFDHTTKCPKCGYNKLDTVYHAHGDTTASVRCEHLLRTCKRCGFKFPQGCLSPEKAQTRSEKTTQEFQPVVK